VSLGFGKCKHPEFQSGYESSIHQTGRAYRTRGIFKCTKCGEEFSQDFVPDEFKAAAGLALFRAEVGPMIVNKVACSWGSGDDKSIENDILQKNEAQKSYKYFLDIASASWNKEIKYANEAIKRLDIQK
jgi:hypothetical protein